MSRNRPNKKPRESSDDSSGGFERLQKALAAAGVGSRRDCEELIQQGRVEVDQQVVTELGTKVDPLRQEIRVDGTILKQPKRAYYALNKPIGVVSTNFDPSGRTRIIDLLPSEERLFPVGRLDRSSEGLIVVTNDGAFANRLTHPRYGVEKTYHVRIAGNPSEKELIRLRKGIHLSDGLAKVVSLRVKGRHKQSTDLEIVLNEGKNREIRRILARVGHKVLALKRTAVGTLKLGEMPPGAWRKLSPQEVTELMSLAKRKRKEPRATGEAPKTVIAPAKGGPRQAVGSSKVGPAPHGARPAGKQRPDQRPPRPTHVPPKMAPPPGDDLLRLEDFLPPLPDDEGDALDAPAGIAHAARSGRVLGYEGDQLPQEARPLDKPRTAKPRGEQRRPGKRAGKPPFREQRETGRTRFGKPSGKFGGKPEGRTGGKSGKSSGKPGKGRKGRR
jgi:23S rRNA pseudouridine2605 synthase